MNSKQRFELIIEKPNSEKNVKKSKFSIHWVDFMLCSMWIFFMLFVGIGLSGGATAAKKYLDSIAGIGRIHTVEFIENANKQARNILFSGVKANAAIATTALQIAQLSFDRIIQIAIVAFVRALLTTIFNFLKTLLNKLKEARNQIAKLFNTSGPVSKLFKLLNGRHNICQKVESFVTGIFAIRAFETPLDLAFENFYSNRRLSSIITNPSEFIMGGAKLTQTAFQNIEINAQSKTPEERRREALQRDEQYLRNNLSGINSNAEGCYFDLNGDESSYLRSIQEVAPPNSRNLTRTQLNNRAASTATRAIYSMADSCSTTNCFETAEQNFILNSTANIIVNSSPTNAPLVPINDNSTLSQSISVFNSFNNVFNPSKSIEILKTENEIKTIANQAKEGSENPNKQPVGGNNENNTLAIAKPSDVQKDNSGSFQIASTDGLCGTIGSGTGSLTLRGQDLVNQAQNLTNSAVPITTEQDVASKVATGSVDRNSRTLCPVTVKGISADTEVTSQAQAAIQQASVGGGGGSNLADAINGLLNSFLQNLANLLIDTLFSFVNTITNSFCSNFAIDSICDSLTTTSKNWEDSLRRSASEVKINSTKYSSFYEYYSGEQKLIGQNPAEIPGANFNNNQLK
jgi:hypothetical protein